MSAWFYARQGQTVGPVSWEQLWTLAQRGELRPEDHVFQEGLGKWVPASTVSGLCGATPAVAPTAVQPAARPDPVPAATAKPPVARPVRAIAVPQAAPAPRPAATGPTQAPTADAGPGLAQRLLALPKPILFGLCGAAGGLLAALLLGELLWAICSPPQQGPSLRMAVPDGMPVYAGGKNRFVVKIERHGFDAPVNVDVEGLPRGVIAPAVTIGPKAHEAEVTIDAGGGVPEGKHELTIRVRGPKDVPAPPPGGLVLQVRKPPPGLSVAVSPTVVVFQGGKARFDVKLARTNFDGPVTLTFQNAPPELLPALEVPADKDEQEIEVSAPRETPVGLSKVIVTATAAAGEVASQTTFNLDLRPAPPPKADVLFVLDLTGSMQFAIDGVKDGIRNFADKLEEKRIDVRIGLIAFRDIVDDGEMPYELRFGDKREPFTKDYQAFRDQVRRLRANGGGDDPESSLQALDLAARQPFRQDASPVLVLITDAEPKFHKDIPPATPQQAAAELRRHGISQVHLVIRRDHYNGAYRPLHDKGFNGSFFDIAEVTRGDAFASLLPKLGESISQLTVASLPTPPGSAAPPPLPTGAVPDLPASAAPTLQAVQSTQRYAEGSEGRLLLSSAVWTAIIAIGISLLILSGQHYYLRKSWLPPLAIAQALGGGLAAGLVGGAVVQLFFQFTGGAASRVIGWSLLGGLLGSGLALFIPNLKWSRGLLGGVIGGLLGALTFLLLSRIVNDLLGRLIGAAVLGFCIGLMVALAELVFRRWWLEVALSSREVRTVTLGGAEISVGGDDRLASVFVQGAPPLALRYRVEAGRVLCEDVPSGRIAEMQPGESRRLAGATITVCSPDNARQSGYRLFLAGGKAVLLGEGMPLTAEDLPGLQPQGTDGVVAIVSRRPSDPRVLILRNRSRQIWQVRKADGTQQSVGPGLGVELGPDLHIDFGGGPQGRVTKT
jgi:hypothetical protein